VGENWGDDWRDFCFRCCSVHVISVTAGLVVFKYMQALVSSDIERLTGFLNFIIFYTGTDQDIKNPIQIEGYM